MRKLRIAGIAILIAVSLAMHACTHRLTPAQQHQVVELKQEVAEVRQEIHDAETDGAAYSGGLIKNLITLRSEILKTNEALLEQRINVLESGAKITLTLDASRPDPTKAAQIAQEIKRQNAKLVQAEEEANRYSGGLVKALADASVATSRNTLALLQQEYFVEYYGLAIPSLGSSTVSKSGQAAATENAESTPAVAGETSPAKECLKIKTFDSSVLSSNQIFTELAWKVDVSNSCDKSLEVKVTFTIYDKDEFELDSDSKELYVAAQNIGKARGKMLISPPAKVRRMSKQGANISEL